jgi:hypothetical protein
MSSPGQNALHLGRNVCVFPAHELIARFDDCDAAAETAIGLRHFDTDVTTAEHDKMGRHIIEFQRFYMRECPGCLKSGNVRDRCVRSDIDNSPFACQQRIPPSFSATSIVLGSTKRPLPMINFAPLSL